MSQKPDGPDSFAFRKPKRSYAEVRRAGLPGDRPLRASAVANAGEETAGGTTNEPSPNPGKPSLSVVAATQEKSAETPPVDKSCDVATASKDEMAAEVAEVTASKSEDSVRESLEPASSEPSVKPDDGRDARTDSRKNRTDKRNRVGAASRSEANLRDGMVRQEDGTIQMLGYIHPPLPGSFPAFDKLVSAYGAMQATKLAIGFGLELLRERIDQGAAIEPMMEYSSEKKRRRYRFRVDPVVFEWVAVNYDPANVLSQHAFSGQLWKMALGVYLAQA